MTIESDLTAREKFEPFSMQVHISDIDELVDLLEAVSAMRGSAHGRKIAEFLKSKLALYERVY